MNICFVEFQDARECLDVAEVLSEGVFECVVLP